MFNPRRFLAGPLVAGATLLSFNASALANGLHRPGLKDYDSAQLSWTGLYVGAGGVFRDLEADVSLPALPLTNASPSPDDWGIDGHAGYRHQFVGGLVLGVEGDYTWFEGDDDSAEIDGFAGSFWKVQSDWSASIRGSLGHAFDRALMYVTGGVAWTAIDGCGTFGGACVAGTQFGGTHQGWTVGAGVGYALTQHVSTRVEYRYSDFEDKNYATPTSTGGVTRVDPDSQELRLGSSFRF